MSLVSFTKIVSGTMIEAGSETTSQGLNNCLVGLLSNPDAVKKAHEELDRVIGTDRTPTFDDEKNLPYIRAIIKVCYQQVLLTI
jgi:cytochrome P450